MVVLASSIITKTGKPLVSRQYVDMSRIRIEGLLAAFPKLVGSGKQHTYVETENVRYVYQPMEGLYLLLVTNKASNILEDLETLRLLAKVVPEYVDALEEDAVGRAAFELIFAFDEVISLGYRENITVVQVKQNTEMESHEEKLHKMIIQSKINDTKDVMKRKAMEIDKSKLERSRDLKGMGYTASGISSVSTRPVLSDNLDTTPTYSRPEPAAFGKAEPKRGGGKGMQLGKVKKGANDFLDSLRAEGDVDVDTRDVPRAGVGGPAAPAAAEKRPGEALSIFVEEKLHVVLNKDGGLEDMEVQGTVFLQALVEEAARVRVGIEAGENAGYQFKTHPNIDKALYAREALLGLKDPERPFPTGDPVGILKWRMQTRDEALVPLSINCWPSASGGDSYVNIEYESTTDFDLQDVVIAIPLPALTSAPRVNQVDGDTHYDARKSVMLWSIDLLDDANRTGALEFVVPLANAAAFFPVEVSFTSESTLCQVDITSVESVADGQPVKHAYRKQLSTDGYSVV